MNGILACVLLGIIGLPWGSPWIRKAFQIQPVGIPNEKSSLSGSKSMRGPNVSRCSGIQALYSDNGPEQISK